MNKMFHSLDDIFLDKDFQNILDEQGEKNNSSKKHPENPDIDKIISLNAWFEKNGKEPTKAEVGSEERKLYNQLAGIRNDKGGNRKSALAKYDLYNLLNTENFNNGGIEQDTVIPDHFDSLDDALKGVSSLFQEDDDINEISKKIFDISQVKKPIKSPKHVGTRIASKEFAKYESMFEKVQKEIASGQRKIIKFKNYDIHAGRFYILKGLICYIEVIGEEFQGSDNQPNARMRVIFENGTESQMLRRAFGASMYSRGGKIITDIESGTVELKNDICSGSIYVVKSLSSNPEISKIDNLYKVGYTSESVRHRVANAENEDTYLYAPVKIVRDYQVMNVDAHKFETVLHHVLAPAQLQVEILAPNGTLIKPREWFVLSLKEIDDAINKIIVEMQK
ncbi:GIY-YIG nuclease family protein [Fructobacillus durionis]|uniref:T5orf172 domain-containing protein n=1 Tax=Fructobacillus durionis TaxID=283737 RepID=A0A1I1GA32_9LACO|nr:GIY-YIG nuclease family protein [Fructobacillus durionis]SFC06183.1 T5orf172 domain-containing protein [Fructobacillus durionis]